MNSEEYEAHWAWAAGALRELRWLNWTAFGVAQVGNALLLFWDLWGAWSLGMGLWLGLSLWHTVLGKQLDRRGKRVRSALFADIEELDKQLRERLRSHG